jgi:hypothetical protein
MQNIHIATEDELSEAVAECLVRTFTNYDIHLRLRRGGNGYLRGNLKSFFEIALRTPVLLITDLDSVRCPSALLDEWLCSVNIPMPPNMLFRIAVREVESWLLADHDAASSLLNAKSLTTNPDSLQDPKKELIRLAAYASRDVRNDIVITQGAVASQGLGYNSRLIKFVKYDWCPNRACQNSESLRRCVNSLKSITPV